MSRCKDIITDKYSGLVVPVKDKKKLKLAIKNFLENPKLALKHGRNAKKTII